MTTTTSSDLALLRALGEINRDLGRARRLAMRALEESGYYEMNDLSPYQLDLVETLDRLNDLSRYIVRKIANNANA